MGSDIAAKSGKEWSDLRWETTEGAPHLLTRRSGWGDRRRWYCRWFESDCPFAGSGESWADSWRADLRNEWYNSLIEKFHFWRKIALLCIMCGANWTWNWNSVDVYYWRLVESDNSLLRNRMKIGSVMYLSISLPYSVILNAIPGEYRRDVLSIRHANGNRILKILMLHFDICNISTRLNLFLWWRI